MNQDLLGKPAPPAEPPPGWIDPAGDGDPREDARPRRPTILQEVGELHKSVDAATRALCADPDTYERDHDLVHVTRATLAEQGKTDGAIIAGTPKIHAMTIANLRVRLCKWASWAKHDRKGEPIAAEPSRGVVEGLLAAKTWPGMRSLKGIIEAPSLRPDGTVLDVEGFDAATGFLYAPSGRFLPVNAEPTQDDARRAYAALAELFDDFPYAITAGQAMAVAALLTLIARPAIPGPVPCFIFDATTPGSGKTLQADVCSAIATGREAGRHHFPFTSGRDRDAELSKVLATIARRGAALVNFDNLDAGNGQFGGSALELCTTARDTYTFRILGKTEGLTVSWRTVVIGSGNNVEWTQDMGRRILVARLESPLENPENRALDTYKHPERAGRLYEHVIEHRAAYVHHALTLLRAYFVAGKPALPGFQSWGSFEAWSATIAGALRWVGAPDPMLCRPSQQADEGPDSMQRRILAREWAAFCLASSQVSIAARDLLAALYPKDRAGDLDPKWEDLRGAIEHFAPPRPGQAPDAAALGYVLKRVKGMAVRTSDAGPPRRFVTDGATHGRQRWRVEDVPAAKIEGDAPAQ